jgi:tripartite-type tricarboxylate transporter receptor subunit TctC
MKSEDDAMMNCTIRHYFRLLPVLLTGVVLLSCDAGQPGDDSSAVGGQHSFASETITVVIGLDASAGGTTVGRLLAKHLELNLAGNPTVIVNNMPGASGLNAHLHVLLKAPNDGTTVYYGPRSSLGELLELPGFSFKYSQFTPLGGVQIGGLVVYSRTDAVTSGVDGPEDIIATEPLLFGGMPPEHGRMIVSTMGLDLIGANYKYIAGYPSSGNIRAAIISGEVNTATDAAHAYLNQVVPVLVDEGHALPIFSMPMLNGDGQLVQNSMVPNVPSLPDLYETLNGDAPSGIVWDSITTLLEIDQTMQHVFLGPPGMDPAAADTFRAGLEEAMTSAAYREEAQHILSYVPEPVGFERQAKILGATASVSPEVLEYIKAHIEKNSRY